MYLEPAELDAIAHKMVNLRLSKRGQVDTFLRDLPPKFVALMTSNAGDDYSQLKVNLRELNDSKMLPGGIVPLVVFLSSVTDSVSANDDIIFFEDFLEKVKNNTPLATPLDNAGGTQLAASGIDWSSTTLTITPEAEIAGKDDTLPIDFFNQASEASRSVFKILIHRHFEEEPRFVNPGDPEFGRGTAWKIAPKLMITNHHVVEARTPREGAAIPEDFDLQGQNTYIIPDYHKRADDQNMIKLAADALLFNCKSLDFALYRLPDTLADRKPLRLKRRNISKMLADPISDRVNILQHPNGLPLRVGFRNNYVVLGDDRVLAYLTDTAGGSSGSPVCDDLWNVAALHRGTRGISKEKIEFQGRLARNENYGIPIQSILVHLKENRPELHTEITSNN